MKFTKANYINIKQAQTIDELTYIRHSFAHIFKYFLLHTIDIAEDEYGERKIEIITLICYN